MDNAEQSQEQKKPRVVIKGEVTQHPEKRHVGKTGIVAELNVAAKEVTVDGVAVTDGEVEAQKWFKVPLWGSKAETAADKFRAGTEITVEGKLGVREWKTKGGDSRSDRVVFDAEVQIDKESARGRLVVLEGKVGRNPVLEETPNGRAFTRLKLESVEGKSGAEVPDKVSVLGWEGQGREMENAFREGDSLRVKGELVSRSWETKELEKRTFWEVQRPEIMLLEKSKDRGLGAERVEVGFESAPDKRLVGKQPAKAQAREQTKRAGLAGRRSGSKAKQQDSERSR
jgi:single-strand DNA-binding protein